MGKPVYWFKFGVGGFLEAAESVGGQQHADDATEDGEWASEAGVVGPFVSAWAHDHEVGLITDGGGELAGCGDGDGDDEGHGVELLFCGDGDGDGEHQYGGGVVGHGGGEDGGEGVDGGEESDGA